MSSRGGKIDLESVQEQLKNVDERLSRIEAKLGLIPIAPDHNQGGVEHEEIVQSAALPDEDEFEFRVGQNWFAKVGIVALALGIAFLLTFPYEGLPAVIPGLFGFVLCGGVFLLSHLWRNSFDLVSRYLRGAAMALLYFTTLRLYFFSPIPTLSVASFFGVVLLLMIIVINLLIALRRESSYLVSLAVTMGYATSVLFGTFWLTVSITITLSILVAYWYLRYQWNGFYLYAIMLNHFTYLILILNNPFLSHDPSAVSFPSFGIYFLLFQIIIFSAGILLRDKKQAEHFEDIACSASNGVIGYGLYAGYTIFVMKSSLTMLHSLSSFILIGLATLFWLRRRSQYSTFIYSMLGYAALSVAILSAFTVPNLFVWLSAQSLIVVATAVWFRSRFIVVSNFIIYLAIVIGYIAATQSESGISIGFGIVALLSARILNWQKERLELKTDLMRIAYLVSAFLVLPYALYHLVPHEYVLLSWIGIAMFYFLMNLIIRNQKYRWMGHLTLLLTVLYALIIGIIQLAPTYRILSFLVLGTVLLAVSLIFTRLRARQQKTEARDASAD